MQQIADWLGKLGLQEYADHFAESGQRPCRPDRIGPQGVLLGHRRKILRAIAGLGSSPPAAPCPHRRSRRPLPYPSHRQRITGERRHVSVMLCDLVGSISISAKLDAELPLQLWGEREEELQ